MSEPIASPLASKPLGRLLLATAVVAIIFHIVVSSEFAAQHEFDIGLVQLIVLPVVAAGILIWGRQLLPPLLTLIAAGLGFVLTLLTFSPLQRGENEVLIARFQGDSMGAQSRIFRKELRQSLPVDATVALIPYHFSISDRAAARAVVKNRKPHSPVIWFLDAHTIVEFPPQPARVVQTPLISNLPSRYQNLRLIEQIPNIVLTTEPRLDTQVFLSNLISGIVSSPAALGSTDHPSGEISLVAAATHRAGWRGLSHQAYAWWLLGNRYLWEASSGAVFEPALLDCAFRAYSRAAKMFRPRDNRELIAAIVNNQSVAMALQAALANDPRRARKARNGFRLSKGYAKGISSKATQTEFFSLINGNLKQIAKRTPRTKAKIKKRVRAAKVRSKSARGHARKKSESR